MEFAKYIPDTLIFLFSMGVQFMKEKYNWEGVKVDLIVLAGCYLLIFPADIAIAIINNPILSDFVQPKIMLGAYWVIQIVLSIATAGVSYFTAVGFYTKGIKPAQAKIAQALSK